MSLQPSFFLGESGTGNAFWNGENVQTVQPGRGRITPMAKRAGMPSRLHFAPVMPIAAGCMGFLIEVLSQFPSPTS